ncbi:MAG: META domain-containing protein [Methanomicrobiales archaeon]
MKILTACVILCTFLVIMMAGCTSQPATAPVVTPVPTAVPATINPTPSPAPITDPTLPGTWYLKMMGEQGGTAPVQIMSPQITAVFTNQSGIYGFSGCNNYNGQYTLTGQVLPNGKGITIGPLASTMMYCADTANTETTYLQILQAAKSYTVNVNQELTITDNLGSVLVYQRTPYNAASVPHGI